MEKTNYLLLSFTNKLLAGLLSLLGFSLAACDKIGTDEYGCPHADYEIKGKVVNEDGTAVPNIQIVAAEDAITENDLYIYRDTIFSDSKGQFSTQLQPTTIGEDITFKIKIEDIDGEQNGGLFEEQTTEVLFKKEDLKDASGNWYYGKATKEVTIVMKNKD